MLDFLNSTPSVPKRQTRPYRPRGRQYRRGRCAAALRALTAAQLYLDDKINTLKAAAKSCGSNVVYVRAAVVLLQAEDVVLVQRALRGAMPLLAAAKVVKHVPALVEAYRASSVDERVRFARAVGAEVLFETVTAAL